MSRTNVQELGEQAAAFFRDLQHRICSALESLERGEASERAFGSDDWQHHSGGGGTSRVMIDGKVFEKAGVNFSRVAGSFTPDMAATMPGAGTEFSATGISLVLHPRNPHVPTVHANFRFIQKGAADDRAGWFGGGSDLTPYYPRREDVVHFHQVWKNVCDRHAVADHARFKKWCDDYFYLPHRKEARGVGGIFFDHLTDRLDEVFAFVRDAGERFLDAYLPIVSRRMHEPYDDRQRRWQLVRRGRYVEFNLLHDRGTMFGLKTGGRVESILMSLPLHVMWAYNETPAAGSLEAELLDFLRPRDWASESA